MTLTVGRHALFGEWTSEDVAVFELSDREWRVSDLRQREENGLALLGFIESSATGYEATGIHDPSAGGAFATLECAVQFLTCSRIQPSL